MELFFIGMTEKCGMWIENCGMWNIWLRRIEKCEMWINMWNVEMFGQMEEKCETDKKMWNVENFDS